MPTFITTISDVCGYAWLAVVCLVALVNFGVALKLVFSTRSVIAVVAFLPVTFVPLWIGVIGSLLSLTQAVELGMSGAGEALNSNLMIAMALLPLAVGGALSVPAYVACAFGRLWLATAGTLSRGAEVHPKSTKTVEAAIDDDVAFQNYADLVTSAGHRRK